MITLTEIDAEILSPSGELMGTTPVAIQDKPYVSMFQQIVKPVSYFAKTKPFLAATGMTGSIAGGYELNKYLDNLPPKDEISQQHLQLQPEEKDTSIFNNYLKKTEDTKQSIKEYLSKLKMPGKFKIGIPAAIALIGGYKLLKHRKAKQQQSDY